MHKFRDGPAKDTTLCCGRAPLLLRVVVNGLDADSVDALDGLDDDPKPEESLYVYQLVENYGTVHYSGRNAKTGKRFGRTEQHVEYALYAVQPDDATMRERNKWQAWAQEQAATMEKRSDALEKKGGGK